MNLLNSYIFIRLLGLEDEREERARKRKIEELEAMMTPEELKKYREEARREIIRRAEAKQREAEERARMVFAPFSFRRLFAGLAKILSVCAVIWFLYYLFDTFGFLATLGIAAVAVVVFYLVCILITIFTAP